MGRSRRDHALWARIARPSGTLPGMGGQDAEYLQLDPASGRLRVESVEPPFRATYGNVNVPATTWTTVADVTPAAEFTVQGYNADLAALADLSYRQRLVSLDAAGAVTATHHVSTTHAAAVAWIPMHVTLPAGQRIGLQVFHGELAVLAFDGTINWRER